MAEKVTRRKGNMDSFSKFYSKRQASEMSFCDLSEEKKMLPAKINVGRCAGECKREINRGKGLDMATSWLSLMSISDCHTKRNGRRHCGMAHV